MSDHNKYLDNKNSGLVGQKTLATGNVALLCNYWRHVRAVFAVFLQGKGRMMEESVGKQIVEYTYLVNDLESVAMDTSKAAFKDMKRWVHKSQHEQRAFRFTTSWWVLHKDQPSQEEFTSFVWDRFMHNSSLIGMLLNLTTITLWTVFFGRCFWKSFGKKSFTLYNTKGEGNYYECSKRWVLILNNCTCWHTTPHSIREYHVIWSHRQRTGRTKTHAVLHQTNDQPFPRSTESDVRCIIE